MVFQKISKMEVVFGNLVEKVSKLDDRRVFFQKISNIEVCFGNLVEKVVGRSGLGEAIRNSLTYFVFYVSAQVNRCPGKCFSSGNW